MKEKSGNLKTILVSLIVMALWGSLYPFVKLGYKAFNMDTSKISNILLFVGSRFTLCGIVISIIAFFKKDKIEGQKGKALGLILLIGLFSIILHYSLLYIGMRSTDSSKSALIKQLGSLLYVCFAFLFFKSEKFSGYKIVGAIVGFLGIIAINFSGGGISFSTGDLLIVLASICIVTANIISKRVLANNSPFLVTGISQLAGGVVLIVVALIFNADLLSFNLKSILVFGYICTASTVSYLLWNYILRTSHLSNMFIIKFAEPLFACIFGAILLGENIFRLQYLFAFILISLGIVLGNKTKDKKEIKE